MEASSDSSSSSSSDSVLIPMPLDQRRRKKLRQQLQADQRRQEEARARRREPPRAKVPESNAKVKAPDTAGDKADDRAKTQGEHICVKCEQEGELLVCAGPCISAFHRRCLPTAADGDTTGDGPWLCPSCRSKTHACFHCKRVGVELLAGEDEASVADGDKRPVRKCRALSCGKFFHQDCITQFPLARIAIAGTHFICPLHTCAGCGQSGAQKEAVRCMRCPVAYHASCLPTNCVRQITSKLIICPKHATEAAQDKKPAATTPNGEQKAATTTSSAEGSLETEAVRNVKREAENEDEAMSEASAVSATSTSASRKREKRDKRDKKKKKKKKKKTKRKELKDRLSLGEWPDGGSGKDEDAGSDSKHKRIKREASTESTRNGPNSPSTPSSNREARAVNLTVTPVVTGAGMEASRSPASSYAIFESPATASKRIQERLVEALGKSDDDEDDEDEDASSSVVVNSPSTQIKLSSSQPVSPKEAAAAGTDIPAMKAEQSATEKTEEDADMETKPEAPKSSSPVAISPSAMANDASSSPEASGKSVRSVSAGNSPSGDDSGVKSEHNKSRRDEFSKSHVASGSRENGEEDAKEMKKQTRETNPGFEDDAELKVKVPTSPSVSALIPSSPITTATTSTAAFTSEVEAHREVTSAGEEGDDEGAGGSTASGSSKHWNVASVGANTPASGAGGTPREEDLMSTGTPRTGTGKSSGHGKKPKKKKLSKTAASLQRASEMAARAAKKEEVEQDEAKWVQCDSCKKWRTVPKDFDLDAMPERWYCNMNTWDLDYASCAVAEEVLKMIPSPQATDKKGRTKVKTKAKSSNATASAIGASDGGGSSSSSGSGMLKKSSSRTSVSDLVTSEDKPAKSSKSKDKSSKKRKISKQLKEKYRDTKWVQCESTQCGKWRVVPASINFDRLPAVWYCHLNTWAPELAKCSAANPPEVEMLLKTAKKDPRPSKKLKTSSSSDAVPTAPLLLTAGAANPPSASGTESHTSGKASIKHGKGSKSSSTPLHSSGTGTGASQTATTSGSAENVGGSMERNTESSATSTQSSGGNGGHVSSSKSKGRSHGAGSGSSGVVVNTSGIKKTVLEWAQCEKCNKWRKLPQHIKSSTLPDKWYCSMNRWDPLHAKCSIPEEADQVPLPLDPTFPNKHDRKVFRRRGKLSYSELLYGSTGQLRKAYTPESSTLSFELEGTTYYRDDQYKHSSMYVSPAAIAAAATMAGWSDRSSSKRDASTMDTGTSADQEDAKMEAPVATSPPQASVDHVAALVLNSMDLRRHRSVSELFDAVNAAQKPGETANAGLVSLAVVTAALGQLEHRGLIEKVTELAGKSDRERRTRNRREVVAPLPSLDAFSAAAHYRKVPTRPLKASKCWKFGTNVLELSPVQD